jgi:hypothetical protein
MNKSKTRKPSSEEKEMTAEEFIALPDAEKNRIVAEIESQTSEQLMANSRPLNAGERARWIAFKKNARKNVGGRPKIGKGSQVISLSVEKQMLKQADAYAKRHGLGRSEMFIKALGGLLGAERESRTR